MIISTLNYGVRTCQGKKTKNKNGIFSTIILVLTLFTSLSMAADKTAISREDALTFAFIADFSSGIGCLELTNSDCRINVTIDGSPPRPMQATSLLMMRIEEALRERSLDNWDTVWGPTMQWKNGVAPGKKKSTIKYYSAANTMVVFKSSNTYVVAIAGTNPISNYGWYTEDFDVTQFVTWPNGSPAGKISGGTAEGLNLLMTMGGGQSAGTNTTLIDYLRGEANIAKVKGEKIEVVVVGHSLGGTLSPVIATTLKDTQTENLDLKWTINKHDNKINLQFKKWDDGRTANVSTIFFAGATPGNQNFANYTNSLMLDSNIVSVANKFDVVPHGWNALGAVSSIGSENIMNIYANNKQYCDQSILAKSNCPYTKTKPPSTDIDKVICPCYSTFNEIVKAQNGAEYYFKKATPIGVGTQREEISLGIAYTATKLAECPSSKALVSSGEKDKMLIQAAYQHDCVYPLNYPSTTNLSSVLHSIRETYKQDLN